MKILFLSRRFYPDVGGVEKHVLEISKVLIKQKHQVNLVTQSQGKISNIENINIVRIPTTPKDKSEKLHIWKWFWENKNLIKDADIIHAHDVFYWYLPFRFIFLSKKCFVTFHGYESYPISKKAIFLRKLWEILSNKNIIVGEFIKKWYHTNPDIVIYGGVNIPKKYSQSKNKKSAIFFGRLDYHTGILDYAKTIDLVRNKIPDFKFTIIGEGEDSRKLKKYNLIGFKKDISKYLDENNFAFVSRYLSVLEALAHKRLVFALYDNPIKEDYLKMSPFSHFIVIENSPEKLAQKVLYYLENPKEANKLISSGYEWVNDKSWENVVSKYLKLWR